MQSTGVEMPGASDLHSVRAPLPEHMQEVIAATAEKFQVLARGAGGIEELSSELPEDDASVVWGLVTCIIGSGTFARTKYVKVNLSGAKCAHTYTRVRTHARTHARTGARAFMLMRSAYQLPPLLLIITQRTSRQ